jgi:hypothetical protein
LVAVVALPAAPVALVAAAVALAAAAVASVPAVPAAAAADAAAAAAAVNVPTTGSVTMASSVQALLGTCAVARKLLPVAGLALKDQMDPTVPRPVVGALGNRFITAMPPTVGTLTSPATMKPW